MLPLIELQTSRQKADELETKMKQAADDRRQLEEAQRRAEELRQQAEEAAALEKEEREMRVC